MIPLTVEQVAERLHVTPEAVRQLISRGRLGSHKPGKRRLVTEDQLRAYVEGRAPRRRTK